MVQFKRLCSSTAIAHNANTPCQSKFALVGMTRAGVKDATLRPSSITFCHLLNQSKNRTATKFILTMLQNIQGSVG